MHKMNSKRGVALTSLSLSALLFSIAPLGCPGSDDVNRAPTANAGPDLITRPGDTVTVDGSGSSDPDGDPLTFAWTQTAGPDVIDPQGADTARPSFTAPNPGLDISATMEFELTVDDGRGGRNADRVQVTVNGGPVDGSLVPLQGCDGDNAPLPISGAPLQPLQRISEPPAGMLYNGFFYSACDDNCLGGWQSSYDNMHNVTPSDVARYEQTVGKSATWVYFAQDWLECRDFPGTRAKWIKDLGKVPYIRLFMQTDAPPEPLFTLEAIADGAFDDDLRSWAAQIVAFNYPVIVEYGTEINGEWEAWNGKWNGGGTTDGYGDPTKPDGPERFVDAYRRIVSVTRDAGATNITWVWHVIPFDVPDEPWNALENYYPGSEFVDWIGVSVYGPPVVPDDILASLTPSDQKLLFRVILDPAYDRLTALDPTKPVIIPEFGSDINDTILAASDFAENALSDLLSNRWPRVIGFSWWSEMWLEGSAYADLVIWDDPDLSDSFRNSLLAGAASVQEAPILVNAP